ncbi:hypothetical protein [Zavarzinella formosa]|uniref:hypothetical protein n=1 Tax=Zavarzinella formosa TaxID=360055 RepID=UPI00031942E6|nr:hypothetical protein [Zavarzinella formosa]
MNDTQSKANLSPARRKLVELMREVNFGRIVDLRVERGQPVLDPAPGRITEHKFGGDNGPRPESNAPNFQLKWQILELFQLLDQIGTGDIASLEVKHGLPFRALIEHPSPTAS